MHDILQEIDHQTLASSPLLVPPGAKTFSSADIAAELRNVFDTFRSEIFHSTTRNSLVLPMRVPGGDWRKADKFKSEARSQWTEPEWTELMDLCPLTREMIEAYFLPWNEVVSRIVVLTPGDARGTLCHRDTIPVTFDESIKLRYHCGGDPYSLLFTRKDLPPLVADKSYGYWCINGKMPHYSTWSGLEEIRPFTVAAGVPSQYNPAFHGHLRDSLLAYPRSVVRIAHQEQDRRRYPMHSSEKPVGDDYHAREMKV